MKIAFFYFLHILPFLTRFYPVFTHFSDKLPTVFRQSIFITQLTIFLLALLQKAGRVKA